MKTRLLSTFILIAYSAILIKVMVFKDLPVIRIGSLMLNFGGSHEGSANLLPFKTILPYLLGEKGFIIAGMNLIGNIVLLLPIGFLVPFVFRNMLWKKIIAVAVATGFVIEGMQALLHVGIFDIDDIILNGLGVIAGYWAFTIFEKMMRSMKPKKIIITAVVIIVIVGMTAFYGVDFYLKRQQPVRFRPGAENGQRDSIDNSVGSILQGADPCSGTGGTGQIVNVGSNSITIKRRDGINVILKLTEQTAIRTSAGAASKSDLKPGDRVTVVVEDSQDDSRTTTTVLVCKEARVEQVK